ncbi:MAG: hypothetical protein LBB67_04110 [Oscillospiraceae bacterium]|jgi:hypothetical protein|nr:hypothetical protein [Oscillospiraceae bacterium]
MIALYYAQMPADLPQRIHHAAGRALLRRVCGVRTVLTAPNGKPYFADGLWFSISHCDGLVMLAVSDVSPVGCDVERLDREPRNAARIKEKLTKTPEDRARSAITLWVRFEAQKKAGVAGEIFMPAMPEGYLAAVCARTMPKQIPIIERIELDADVFGDCSCL